jgi:hypothetical protein
MERAEIEVSGFEWDYEAGRNVEHIAAHRVIPADVEEVLANTPHFYLNDADHMGGVVMLGPNFAGRYLFVAMYEAHDAGIWYVATAHWFSRPRAERIYFGSEP